MYSKEKFLNHFDFFSPVCCPVQKCETIVVSVTSKRGVQESQLLNISLLHVVPHGLLPRTWPGHVISTCRTADSHPTSVSRF